MNINNFTIKSQELLQKTMDYAASQSHQQVEPEHLMFLLLTTEDSIISQCLKKIGIDPKMISIIIEKEVQSFPRISYLQPNSLFLSKILLQLLDKAYEQTLSMKDKYVGTEHLFLAFFDMQSTVSTILKNSGLDKDVFLKALVSIRGSKTITEPTAEEHYNSIERYAKDLNLMAKQNKLDPVIGRDDEIRRVLQILSRRTKNNPVLIGDPGVGKTAIVEGLAHKIISGDAPDNLATKRVFALDISSLVAGTKFRGEFEERMKSVIKEVTSSNGEIVLFIDEIHLLVGAGNASEGAMDAANILKPALARGEIHVIGATTLTEYKKYIEKDAALERRFQPVIVNEPSVEDTISILRGLKEKYEIHHGVRISDSALIAAAELSDRYISDRFLPDKAIDVIDEVGSKFRLDINSVPEEIDKLNREIRKLEIERAALLKELNSEA